MQSHQRNADRCGHVHDAGIDCNDQFRRIEKACCLFEVQASSQIDQINPQPVGRSDKARASLRCCAMDFCNSSFTARNRACDIMKHCGFEVDAGERHFGNRPAPKPCQKPCRTEGNRKAVPDDVRVGYLNLGFEFPPDPGHCMKFIPVAKVLDASRTLLRNETKFPIFRRPFL